jgi:hypothetical protein
MVQLRLLQSRKKYNFQITEQNKRIYNANKNLIINNYNYGFLEWYGECTKSNSE